MSINIIKVYQNLVLKEFPIAKHLGVNIHNIEENSVLPNTKQRRSNCKF